MFIDSIALMSLNCAALLSWNLFKDLLRHTSALLIRNTAVDLFGAVIALLVRSDCAPLTTFLVTFNVSYCVTFFLLSSSTSFLKGGEIFLLTLLHCC